MRTRVIAALLLVLAACGDDDAATTTSTTTTTVAGPSGPVVDGFDGTTGMTLRYFADRAQLEWLEGGVLRLTRTGSPDSGFALTGLYPGTHSDATFTLRFRPIPTDDTSVTFGVLLLGDDDLTQWLEVSVLTGYGSVMIIPILEGYPDDYVYGDNAVTESIFHPTDWNELQVTLSGGRIEATLNGTAIATLEGLPIGSGRFGFTFGSTQPGQGVEIDEFRMEPAA